MSSGFIRTLRSGTPPDLLLALHARFPERYPVLLESVAGGGTLGRYDLLFACPGVRLVKHGDGRVEREDLGVLDGGGFLAALDHWWAAEKASALHPGRLPFAGGWFLYLGYELAGEIEPSLSLHASERLQALAWRMHAALLRDRDTGEILCIAEEGVERGWLENVERDLASLADGTAVAGSTPGRSGPLVRAVEEEDPDVFLAGVAATLEAIARGDVYQANLSRPWSAELLPGVSGIDLYRRLRVANPAPFAGIAVLPGFTLLSSSPERLLSLRDGLASTRPIAGTRPRGRDAAADDSLKVELRLNEKEQAEHVMLVDLERNDLGRICQAGTVEVDEFMTIESYAHVHHIVSNVRGVLRPGVTAGQAIAAVFPGGTITGCPKVRCMQLLAELEPEPREAYTGSMGYLGLDGSLDLNILIRTFVVADSRAHFRTGGGIVADSRPQAELAETRAKARGLLAALGLAA